jgi:hypothetical protein
MKAKLLFLIILISISCINKIECQYKIDPRLFAKNEISLAEIAEDIRYIPLDNYYRMGDIVLCKIIDNKIYIKSRDLGLIVFNKEGKNPKPIGSIGRGPGEYLYCISFTVDQTKGRIYTLDIDEIIKEYSIEGEFIKSIPLKQHGAFHFTDIEFSDSKLFLFEYISMGRGKYNWIVLDTNGNIINSKLNSIPKFRSGMGADGGVYNYENKIYYWNMYNDTVFSISPGLKYKASYIFARGEHRMPMDQVTDRSPYIIPRKILETNRFLFFEFFDKQKISTQLYVGITLIDKNSKKTYTTHLMTERSNFGFSYFGGVINNIDGGAKFRPLSYYVDNKQEYLIGAVEAFRLKALVTSKEFKNSTPKYPEKKKDLENLANNLKETDNPVLMIVKLKQ